MARSRGSRSVSRPQRRSASTAAISRPAPPASNAYSQPPAASAGAGAGAQPRQPGMFAQMASTAAGVAVGSTVGHAVSGLLFGGGSAPAEQPVQQQAMDPYASQRTLDQEPAQSCDGAAKSFTKCLDENNGNFQICDYYLQQLKACQEAARQY
ncbi:hypothetical protein NCAS_0H01500 [Naumovozyma castellii]|uniref:CHCH domain-containing protein n=1 Tax=Naumovozyma castellii TaxID=27288 RepID=G0VIY3_NAUCA|nr:hypothetical protein NCAS_0H01500 [Naumovozyma castellii CBS 4309]CCC71460.1 hypothetical protein NCAS_0H01500 [Naumovozyma castellii CBS 4309]